MKKTTKTYTKSSFLKDSSNSNYRGIVAAHDLSSFGHFCGKGSSSNFSSKKK